MFWGDAIVDKIEKNLKDRIESGKPLIIRDEKTASGRIHIGSMRGVAVHGTISEILTQRGIKNKFLYEINDFDPMDGLPVYLDEKEYGKYIWDNLSIQSHHLMVRLKTLQSILQLNLWK